MYFLVITQNVISAIALEKSTIKHHAHCNWSPKQATQICIHEKARNGKETNNMCSIQGGPAKARPTYIFDGNI